MKLEFTELTDVMKDVDFKVFSARQHEGPAAWWPCACLGRRAAISRGEIDGYTEFVKIYGAKGLAWIKVNDAGKGRDGLQSPIVKNLHDAPSPDHRAPARQRRPDLLRRRQGKIVNDAIGALRQDRPWRVQSRRTACSRTAGAAVGGGLPDVRVRRGCNDRWPPCTTRSPAEGRDTKT